MQPGLRRKGGGEGLRVADIPFRTFNCAGLPSMDLLAPLTQALFFVWGMPMSFGDMFGFLTGVVCVWLTARASIWNFPAGILSSAMLGLVFLQQRLFADASLQIVFIVLSAQGWAMWSRRKPAAQSAQVRGTSLREQLL